MLPVSDLEIDIKIILYCDTDDDKKNLFVFLILTQYLVDISLKTRSTGPQKPSFLKPLKIIKLPPP